MPTVTRHPAPWAVHTIYMIPSDYVLADRFGAAQDEAVFMQRVEDQVHEIQQWFWDVMGGYTFSTVPATYYRCSLTAAQIFATYPDYFSACLGILAEMEAKGLYDRRTPHRLPNMYLPLDIEGAGNSIPLTSAGSPWFPWGAVVGAGAGGRIFGGLLPNFMSVPTTIVSPASASATSLSVASGRGKLFAVAARLHLDSARVQSFPGTQGVGTQIVCTDVNWVDTLPFDAVVWQYSKTPTGANAEAIQVTAVNTATNTITVVRGRYGTSPIVIDGGGYGGGGSVIARRQKSARIWTSPGTPEGGGFEVVNITGISGDTLTVQRGQADAYVGSTGGSNTTPRAILAGDNIVVTEPYPLNFYQNQRQATGAFAHELGHNFGMTHYTPAQVQSNPYVDSSSGSPVVKFRDRTGESRPSVDSVTGVDFWEHLPHTQNNPLTPGNFGPYVMINYYDYPFGNVAAPAAGFTANELARVLASPYLTAQARP